MKAKVTVGAAILVILAIFATAFAFMNYTRVQVWPLRGMYPLTVVIVASAGLGLACGMLATFLLGYFKTRRVEGVIEQVQPGQRDRPGRP